MMTLLRSERCSQRHCRVVDPNKLPSIIRQHTFSLQRVNLMTTLSLPSPGRWPRVRWEPVGPPQSHLQSSLPSPGRWPRVRVGTSRTSTVPRAELTTFSRPVAKCGDGNQSHLHSPTCRAHYLLQAGGQVWRWEPVGPPQSHLQSSLFKVHILFVSVILNRCQNINLQTSSVATAPTGGILAGLFLWHNINLD